MSNPNTTADDLSNLKTLDSSGAAPKDRIGNALQAKAIFDALLRADMVRSKKRALLKGMLDGNPPYRQADLDANGRGYQCNVNWRIADSYFQKSVGSFYDIFSEASTFALVCTKKGTPQQRKEWSDIITKHFDWLLRGEPSFDYNMQISQQEMVYYGTGPMVFQDEFDWRPYAILSGALKVPERAKSDTSYWELCTVERDYLADELYAYIKDEESAARIGWNVEATKQAIMRAHPEYMSGKQYQSWTWHQEELKNGSLSYGMRSRTIPCVHVFNREFPKEGEQEGRISQKIILASVNGEPSSEFLFSKTGRYDSWANAIHPMYYNHGQGGFHHAVNGMGLSMYSAVEYQNRLKCNLADKAFTPKMMFKPTTEQAFEDFALQQMGEYAIINPGVDMIQTPIAGVMQEGLEFDRELTGQLASNMGQYRSDTSEKSGNPVTAKQVEIDYSEQNRMGKTQLNRYYQQEDGLLAEMYRRASAPLVKSNPGAVRALEFQERCKKDGVPIEALREVDYVKANRVIGQGSEMMRRQILTGLWMKLGATLPETGRDNLISDIVSADAGYNSVERYYPNNPKNELPNDQNVTAMLQVSSMKDGVPAVVTDTQNPIVFIQTFMGAAFQALQSIQQGANPNEVESFLELAGQGIAQHMQKLANDPSRKAIYKSFEEQFKQLAQASDQLRAQLQQAAQQAQQAQQQRQQISEQGMLAAQESQAKMSLKANEQKFKQALKLQNQQFQQQMDAVRAKQDAALRDAQTAADIAIKAKKTHAETQIKKASKNTETAA